MNLKVAKLTSGLVVLWILVATLRTHVANPVLVHAILALVLVAAGIGILMKQTGGDKASLTAFFHKPQGRMGYRLSLAYFIGTNVLFMAFHSNTWQYSLPNHINSAFLSISSAMAVLVAPVYEEYFFRGCLQPVMAQKLESHFPSKTANLWAVYVSALVFWLFHAPLSPQTWQAALAQGAIPLSPGSFFLGLVCGFIFMRDGSLWFAILIHAFANLLGPVWGGILPSSLMPYFFANI